MTIYQAMKLNVKNLKAAISDTPTKKDKHLSLIHIYMNQQKQQQTAVEDSPFAALLKLKDELK